MHPHKVLQVKKHGACKPREAAKSYPHESVPSTSYVRSFRNGTGCHSARAETPVVVSDAQAEQHLGQDVTVEGVVTAVSMSLKGNTFINFGGVYRTRPLPVGFPLAHRWLMTRQYRNCRGRKSRSQEELSFIAESLRSESYQRVRLLKSRSFANRAFSSSRQTECRRFRGSLPE
jgi:hypothetical protein